MWDFCKFLFFIFVLILVFLLISGDCDKYVHGGGKNININSKRIITYYIEPSLLDVKFKEEASAIIKNGNIKHKIMEIQNAENADITVRLVSRESLNKHHDKPEYYPSGKQIRFSLTWQHPKPHIAIDSVNWSQGVPESKLSLAEYRRYVILHEFMHGLGYDHQPCNSKTAPTGICPILYQSTRGPPPGFKCGYNITEFDYGKKLSNAYL